MEINRGLIWDYPFFAESPAAVPRVAPVLEQVAAADWPPAPGGAGG